MDTHVVVHSDRLGAGPYRVALDPAGKAIACTCIGWTRWHKCYHASLAELESKFQAARTWLEELSPEGWNFGAKFEATVEAFQAAGERHPVLSATRRVLEVARKLNASHKAAEAPVGAPCPRCGGEGWIPAFSHVEDGICFRCRGGVR